MDAEQFTMWLHGFFELSGAEELNKTQTQIVKDHLSLLFDKVTPDRSERLTEAIKKMRETPLKFVPGDTLITTFPPMNPRQVLC